MKGNSTKYWLAFLVFLMLLVTKKSYSQDVDLENIYKPKFKVTGGINANTIFYTSNQDSSREPFSYLLSGNLNLSAFTFSIPISYSITNQGNNLGYSAPFDFNRLCIMPKYKWVKAYIGNVSMTFSPYTLSGFPFRGFGLELTPRTPFKISLMGGKLFKAINQTDALGGIPVYERFGYGTKIGFEKESYKIGWIGFFAKDNQNSLTSVSANTGVTPKENWVNSLIFSTSLVKNLSLNVEYTLSVLTEDTRAKNVAGRSFKDKFFSAKESTNYLDAVNINFDYSIQKTKLGLTYERVDPNYSTLGALFFNNDLENIALRLSRPFYKDNINVTASLGLQRDDLAQNKKQNSKRIVGSINMNYKINDQINCTGSYSNFSMYTNKRLNQFELINNPNIVAADTLNYRQLSQNANFNMTYAFGKKKNQKMNFNYSIAGQANEQGGVIRKGQASTIQNYRLGHIVTFTKTKTALNSSLNYTNNQVGRLDNSVLGGSVNVSKKLLKEKLNSNLGLLYNNAKSETNSSAVMGINLNNSYTLLKKHNLTLGMVSMFRSSTDNPANNDVMLNFNYSYSF